MEELEKTYYYALKIAIKRQRFTILRKKFPEDFNQTLWIAVLSNKRGKELAREVDKELWRLGRDLGFFIRRNQVDLTNEICGCSNCKNKGVYRDLIFGRLCRKHYNRLRQRIKLNWKKPYERLCYGERDREDK